MTHSFHNQNPDHHYSVAGVTLRVRSDMPLSARTFCAELEKFWVPTPGQDCVLVSHHFFLPKETEDRYGELIYHHKPWRIYSKSGDLTFVGFVKERRPPIFEIAKLDFSHQAIEVYHINNKVFQAGNLHSLTLTPTDQIALSLLLADRQACYVHSAGMIYENKGLLFVGHSEAGKSTMVKLLRDESEILCDDRIILRRWPDGIKIHGTWSHGEIPDVSPASAPLRALLFLEKAPHNALVPMTPGEVARALPQYVIKALAGRDWWLKTLDLVEHVAREVPAYRVQFDKSGAIKELLRQL